MSQLKNKTFLITRAAHQASQLIKAIENQDGHCIGFPCIEILKPQDTHIMDKTLDNIAQFDICIFTSGNAVAEHLYTRPKHTIAIGPTTAATLSQHGIDSIIPTSFNSEGVLELEELQSITDKKIAIFTGENPRPLLQEKLRERGASVTLVYCYRRQCPLYSADEIKATIQQPINTIIVNSNETLLNLYQIFEQHCNWLLNKNLLVTSSKMNNTATQLGFKHISSSPDSTADSIVNTLLN
jgi:uroporphyrinogen-III synthase